MDNDNDLCSTGDEAELQAHVRDIYFDATYECIKLRGKDGLRLTERQIVHLALDFFTTMLECGVDDE